MPAPLYLTKIRQNFPRDRIADVALATSDQLQKIASAVPRGGSIAVAVGSRGIANLSSIVQRIVEGLQQLGAKPFIVPAMGSHGGATPEGQQEVLASYGITETSMGCPIRSSLEVIALPHGDLANAVYMDRFAHESDGVILINRIKPHTDFHARYESGLVKMCVIGLGKEKQAFEMHCYGTYGLKELVPRTAARLLGTGKILAGIAIVENAYDETMVIEAIAAHQILEREPELLQLAHRNMPSLPVDEVDVLIIDRMGKNISGCGMDTNIIGRIKVPGELEPRTPRIKAISVNDLSEESHGNGTGVGLADVTTRRLSNKIDFSVTYKNIVTSAFLERGKLPIVAETDRLAFEYALRSAGKIPEGQERLVRILDTLHLSELYVSPAILESLRHAPNTEILTEPMEMFDQVGNLQPF